MPVQKALRLKLRITFLAGLLLLGGLAAPPARAASLQCQTLPILFDAFLKRHYSIKTLSEEVKAHTIEQFIKVLDPSKTLLIEEDAVKLKKELLATFETVKRGNCDLLAQASKLLISRAKEDEAFVKTFLGKDYKLDESVELNMDPDKRGYPKTGDERRELLRKMVHFQISNYLLTDLTLPNARKQLIHRYELVTRRLKEREENSGLVTLYAEAFALALDPHSSYLSQESLEDFQIQLRLSLEGIGASLRSDDGFTVIEDLIPGGGADRIKLLLPKDKIIAVAQDGQKPVPVIDMDLRDVVKMIRGKKGTKVTLTILRAGAETFKVTIVRDKIDIKDQAAKISYETRKVGDRSVKIAVIDLPSFYGDNEKGGRSAYVDMKTLLAEAKKEKAEAVVLDLSRNGGGLLVDAVRISGLFIRKGGVVATKDSDQHTDVLADEDENTEFNGPLVVLISRLSASASEILAGALKDYKRALIVGSDQTFGKGTVQVLNGLPHNLGAMKVTTGMFFLPGGESTQHAGVHSDVLVPSIFNNEDVGEKIMDYSLPPQSIDPFLAKDANASEAGSHWVEVSKSLVKKLTERSTERVAKDPGFVAVRKDLEEAAKNKGVVRLAELRKKAKKPDDKKAREQELKDKEAPSLQESVNIAADMIELEKD